jgi:hypothetical protein
LAADVVGHDHVHDVVPVTACHAPPSTCTATAATAVLSELVPLTTTLPVTDEPLAGAAKATDGGVVSLQVLQGLPACAAIGKRDPMHRRPAMRTPSRRVRGAKVVIAGAAFGRRWLPRVRRWLRLRSAAPHS